MKEYPILFSKPMVEAILAGRKTQTRRIVKPQPHSGIRKSVFVKSGFEDGHGREMKFPYGEIGEVLWVRETFYALGKWVKNGSSKSGKQKYKFIDMTLEMGRSYMYEANSEKPAFVTTKKDGLVQWYKRPSLFMPYVACRLKLEITGRRVEQLLSISEKDAKLEGVETCIATREKFGVRTAGMRLYRNYERTDNSLQDYPCNGFDNAQASFETLWESINGEESLSENPFVWVIEFKKLEVKP